MLVVHTSSRGERPLSVIKPKDYSLLRTDAWERYISSALGLSAAARNRKRVVDEIFLNCKSRYGYKCYDLWRCIRDRKPGEAGKLILLSGRIEKKLDGRASTTYIRILTMLCKAVEWLAWQNGVK